MNKLTTLISLLSRGRFKFVFNLLKSKIHSKKEFYILNRDLSHDFTPPRSLIKFKLRTFTADDEPYFHMDQSTDSFNTTRISTCYVAETEKGEPCYRQWLIDSSQNDKIEKLWGNSYPQLGPGEALLESAFTVPKFRGFGLMPSITYAITELARKQGISSVVTYVPVSNSSSIKGLLYAGFKASGLKTEQWNFFRRRVHFKALEGYHKEQFEKLIPNRLIN